MSSFRNILVIDDEENIRHSLSLILSGEGYHVTTADSGKDALQKTKEEEFDFILCDIRMPDIDGIEFLKQASLNKIAGTIIMMSAYGSVDMAIEAMRLGAYDYISKPFKADEIILCLKKALEREALKIENRLLKEELNKGDYFSDIVAKSSQMKGIFETIKKIADFKITVLIQGESGTGKELIARAIHNNSNRRAYPFIPVNCGAIPENLLESEFFGHVKGAFTDAYTGKKGLFEEANGGTLFLDEIGELPQHLQVKLLRVLQENEIRRVGANNAISVDVRIIAATLKDLSKEVSEGRFRDDLFYRLNVMAINIPPLRERKDDIPILVEHFIDKHKKRLYKPIKGISEDAMNRLINYHWRGNIRELENIIERAIILTDGDIIKDIAIPLNISDRDKEEKPLNIKGVLKNTEKELILDVLKQTNNNKVQTAKLLDISYRSLMYKLKEYNIG